MKRQYWIGAGVAVACAGVAAAVLGQGMMPRAGGLQTPPVDIALKGAVTVAPADQTTVAIVAAAQAFLTTLDDTQRASAVFPFTDNTQRSNWSNFPDGPVQRQGVMRGDMSDAQLAALETLLQTVMSDEGYANVRYQLAAEETLDNGGNGGARFGDEYYYVSFLGEPSVDAPWMLQFGGHHLAINVTVVGPDLSFAPMLTGGEPLRINLDDQAIYITETETLAAQALMDSLSDDQKAVALRSDTAINLLLGPGEFGTMLAPEGIPASDLDAAQRALLVDVIEARIGFLNDDDAAAKMAEVMAGLDDTYFGWWGPQGELGMAYFRVTGPQIVLEYAPQEMDGDASNHAHNMYREPDNDYGIRWIAQ